jgi:hypothetical protein
VERFGRMDYAFNNAGAEQQPKASSVSRLDPSGAVQVDAEHPSRNRKVAGLNSTLRSKQQKARPPGARWVLRARWCVHASGDRIARSRWTQPVTPGWAGMIWSTTAGTSAVRQVSAHEPMTQRGHCAHREASARQGVRARATGRPAVRELLDDR